MERPAILPSWQGNIGQNGALLTINVPPHRLPLQKWLAKRINRIRRAFLWKGEEPEKVSGAHSLVN